jgi:two-component system CheB/CheR fusion protein
VIINKKADIIYIHGRTGKYLEPAPGEASLNILEMAREGFRRQLASAIDKATSQDKDVTHEGLPIKDNGGFQIINVTVKPVHGPEAMRGLMMVVFEDVASPKQAESGRKSRASKKKVDKGVEELERQLQYTNESLQTTIEELETSNEEIKSTNEELQSTNEELQSANEELSTSKEELQSLNEELVTVNTELQEKIDEVTKANNDMHNLIESTGIATIFLDKDLCIRGFTSHADKVINLIQADVGRPIHHIASNLKYEKLGEDAKEVFKTIMPRETEVQTKDGHWRLMRIMPYRTIDNVIDGVAITFVDIHEQKMAAERLQKLNQAIQEAREYAESIVETVREPLLVLDGGLQVISANRSFFKTFQVKPEETKGSLIYELGNRQWDIPMLRELLEDILPQNTSLEGFEVEHHFPTIGRKKMLLNARKIVTNTMGKKMILLAIEDITVHKQKGGSRAKVKE